MNVETIRQIQLSKVIGELNVLISSYYDPTGRGIEKYQEVKEIIDNIIDKLISNV